MGQRTKSGEIRNIFSKNKNPTSKNVWGAAKKLVEENLQHQTYIFEQKKCLK